MNKSRKLSGSRNINPLNIKPLESLVFFLDQDTSCEAIVTALLAKGASRVIRLRDHFPDPGNTPDEVWLEECGKNTWIFVSRNWRIRYVPSQREKVMRHKVKGFFITSSESLRGDQMAERIESAAEKIADAVRGFDGPFLAKIQSQNVVRGWYGTCEGEDF